MLKELMEEYHKELEQDRHNWKALDNAIKRLFPHAKYGQRTLTPTDDLMLMKDFLQAKDPSLDEVKFISSLSIGEYHRGRLFVQQNAKVVMEAYKLCAEELLNYTGVEDEKRQLVKNIDAFINNHIETKRTALDIYDKYLFDVYGAIVGISSCMENQPKLLEKGFTVMHKAADALCKQKELDRRKNPKKYEGERGAKYAATFDLESAFRGLYRCYSAPKLEQYWDKITENLMNFDEQIHRFQFSNILLLGRDYTCTELMYAKSDVLWESLREAEKNEDVPLRKIYEKNRDETYREEPFLNKKAHSDAVAEDMKKTPKVKQIDLSEIDFVYTGKERPTQEKFDSVRNYSKYDREGSNNPAKASGGLWTSPIMKNGKTDWENWLDEQEGAFFEDNKRGLEKWHLVPQYDCRILYVGVKDEDKEAAVRKYIRNRRGKPCTNEELKQMKGEFYYENSEFGRRDYVIRIDYEAMKKDYDAIYVPTREDGWSPLFFAWDVASMHIFNLREFEVMDDKEYKQYKAKQFEETVEKASKSDKLIFKKAGKTDFNRALMRELKNKKQK